MKRYKRIFTLPCRNAGSACLLLAVASLAMPCATDAHPLDSYATDQYVDLLFSRDSGALAHRIEFAEIPTAVELNRIDTNRDADLSEEEKEAYLASLRVSLLQELELLIDSQAIPLSHKNGDLHHELGISPRIKAINLFEFKLPPLPETGLPMEFHLKHRGNVRGDRQIRLLCQGYLRLDEVWSSEPNQPFGMAPPFIGDATALIYGAQSRWRLLPSPRASRSALSSIQSASRATMAAPPDPFLTLNPRGMDASAMMKKSDGRLDRMPPAAEKKRTESWADQQFTGLITRKHEGSLSLSFLVFASLMALVYGAAHALEPGHGKTIVAAYLVGAHGTVGHALILALIVTFTHTFSVYLLGLIALTNLDKVQGTYLPWIECGSWGLIVFMGIGLFFRYYRAYILGLLADPNFHTHLFGQHHSHTRTKSQDLDHHHGHDHNHSHDHPHPHPHDHDHGAEKAASEVRFSNLLTLGITGGILPCPGALFVMMMALSSGRAAIGLYLISVFSIGLALALMTVGIVMVRSRKLFDAVSPNSKLTQFLPVLSSLIIILVGAGFLLNGLIKYGIVQINL